jgi:hypothetical protein
MVASMKPGVLNTSTAKKIYILENNIKQCLYNHRIKKDVFEQDIKSTSHKKDIMKLGYIKIKTYKKIKTYIH